MQRRLIAAGIRTISLPVDITNYLMLELGQPMHVFDLDRLSGGLVVRRAAPGEKLTTLDGVARVLDAEDMVICDDTGPISLAAVMGGETSEWQPDTVDVLLEAAHWDPVMVGRTARRHKLFSEAAKRWERGVDPPLALVALERAVQMLTAHAGGTVDERVLDIDHVAAARRSSCSIPALPTAADRRAVPGRPGGRAARPGRLHGRRASSPLEVTPPTWRPDLLAPTDLVEEVARLGGYNDIPSLLPPARGGSGLTPAQRRRRTVGRALAENGYVEVLSYPFVAPGTADALGYPADDPRRSAVRLTNPLSEEEPLLRTSLLPPLLATLKRNLGRGQRDLALYEIGHGLPAATWRRPRRRRWASTGGPTDEEWAAANAIVPDQPWHLAVVLAGDVDPAGWWGAGPRGRLGRRDRGGPDRPGRRRHGRRRGSPCRRPSRRRGTRAGARPIAVDGQVIGYAGELHPAVVAALELPRRTCAMEIDLDAIPPAPVVAGPADLVVPAGADRRGAGAATGDGAGGRGRGGADAGARASCWSRSRCSTCTSRTSSGQGKQVAGLQADVPRAGPDADLGGGAGGPGRGGRGRGRPLRCHAARRLTGRLPGRASAAGWVERQAWASVRSGLG